MNPSSALNVGNVIEQILIDRSTLINPNHLCHCRLGAPLDLNATHLRSISFGTGVDLHKTTCTLGLNFHSSTHFVDPQHSTSKVSNRERLRRKDNHKSPKYPRILPKDSKRVKARSSHSSRCNHTEAPSPFSTGIWKLPIFSGTGTNRNGTLPHLPRPIVLFLATHPTPNGPQHATLNCSFNALDHLRQGLKAHKSQHTLARPSSLFHAQTPLAKRTRNLNATQTERPSSD